MGRASHGQITPTTEAASRGIHDPNFDKVVAYPFSLKPRSWDYYSCPRRERRAMHAHVRFAMVGNVKQKKIQTTDGDNGITTEITVNRL